MMLFWVQSITAPQQFFFLKEQQLFSETSLPTRIKKEENDIEPCLIRAATSSELKALKSDRLQVAGP